jgi:uncharacterized protein YbjT (DUF2867 family)
VAAVALSDDSYASTIVEVAGPPVSARDRVALISQAIGREIRFEELERILGRPPRPFAQWANDHVAAFANRM